MAMCCLPAALPLREGLALGNGLRQTWLQAQPHTLGLLFTSLGVSLPTSYSGTINFRLYLL